MPEPIASLVAPSTITTYVIPTYPITTVALRSDTYIAYINNYQYPQIVVPLTTYNLTTPRIIFPSRTTRS